MSIYLEIPKLSKQFPYRMFSNDGMTIVYPHWHKEVEIIYANRGKVNIGLNQQIIELEEGEVIYFASGEPHYFLGSPDSERYVYQFDLKLFDELFLRTKEEPLLTLLASGEHWSRFWPKELQVSVTTLLLELHDLKAEHPVGENYLILSCLYRLIGQWYQKLPQKEESQVKETAPALQQKETLSRLDKIFDYIEAHYQEVITVDKVAHFIGFSPYYFTRFFKKNTGQTFMQFLTEYRLNQAKFILANEKLPMAEVAEKAGFASVKTFHHVFKEAVGQSPLQYQKSLLDPA